MEKLRLYVDEVGDPDLASSGDPNHRFLSLTGIALSLQHVSARVHPELESLKRSYFGSHPDEPVVLHRREIVNARPPFGALVDDRVRVRFDAELLARLGEWEYTVVTVCLDKKRHRERYNVWHWDPYHYCMAVLLERFVLLLDRRGARGDVMAESRGGREDRRLKDSYRRLWSHGTEYIGPHVMSNALTSRELKVKPKSANVAGLQVADLIAHPSRAEILIENGYGPARLAPFASKIIHIIQSKYDQHGGRVFGRKLL